MPRIRTVKPELFLHEKLFDAERASKLPLRLSFIGLFTQVDREGRFKWRPRALKAAILPFDNTDFDKVLRALVTHGFIGDYEVEGEKYGHIISWKSHQVVNKREKQSEIPEPPEITKECALHGQDTEEHRNLRGERKGKEGKGRERNEPSLRSGSPETKKVFARCLLPDRDGSLLRLFTERQVSEESQERWMRAFPDPDWIASEVHAAVMWEAERGHRKLNFSRFVSNWLKRGWDRRRVSVGKAQSPADRILGRLEGGPE